uniref:G-protein coupled receptors family 1 profile domain-containing protein n=1 Tax=Romanomermis culicivorax TaxID=13658 RepID=A0A915HFH7_ROMCU
MAIFAVWMCFLVIIVVLKLTLLHRNVRILLVNAFAAAILNTICQSAVASYNIAYYFNPADAKLNKLQCFFLTFLLVPSYRLFMEFLGILTLERCLLSFLSRRILHVHHERRSLFLTLILALCLYFLNGYFAAKSLVNVAKVANQTVEFCNSFFTVDSSAQSFDICVYTVVQVALAILFW